MPNKVAPAPPPPKVTAENPTGLPPPGDERREVLRQRTDELAQKAEARAAELEIEAIDPTKLEPINEAMSLFDLAMQITGALPEKRYCYVAAEKESWKASPQVQLKKAEGWEVVTGDMPEAREKEIMGKDGGTTRWWIDTILMRTSVENYERLRRRAAEKQHRVQSGVDEGLQDFADRYRGRITVHQQLDQRMASGAAAEEMAGRQVDNLIRTGRMPGVQVRS